jgi:sugar-specific transcriptional regulator TrmB
MSSMDETVNRLQEEVRKEQELRRQLEADNKAIKEEFSKANTAEEAVETARKFIEESLPEAIITMRSLMANSTSDSVRSGLSKYVVDIVLHRKHEDSDTGGLKDLLKSLGADAPIESKNEAADAEAATEGSNE